MEGSNGAGEDPLLPIPDETLGRGMGGGELPTPEVVSRGKLATGLPDPILDSLALRLARPPASITFRSTSFCSFSSTYFICSAACWAICFASMALENSSVNRTSRRTTSSMMKPSL